MPSVCAARRCIRHSPADNVSPIELPGGADSLPTFRLPDTISTATHARRGHILRNNSSGVGI